MDLKQLPVACGAEFDSYTNQYEDYCLPGTRTDLLRQIMEWANLPDGKCIFWLNGRAGTGKSTISRTVTVTLQKANLLGASFFFKRGEGDRGNAMKLFTTVTIQLANSIPQLVPGVQKAIHDKQIKPSERASLSKPLSWFRYAIMSQTAFRVTGRESLILPENEGSVYLISNIAVGSFFCPQPIRSGNAWADPRS